MYNLEDENNDIIIDENMDIEVVFGDDSELEFSDVEEFAQDLKPVIKEKKKNVVIPIAKSQIKSSSNEENKDKEIDVDNSENEE